jgi:hypothetical protein
MDFFQNKRHLLRTTIFKDLKEEYLTMSNQIRIQQYKTGSALVGLFNQKFSSYYCTDLI